MNVDDTEADGMVVEGVEIQRGLSRVRVEDGDPILGRDQPGPLLVDVHQGGREHLVQISGRMRVGNFGALQQYFFGGSLRS